MKDFPDSSGENCFLEIIRNWIFHQTGQSLEESYLYMVSGSFDFQYSAEWVSETEVFPKVDIVQKYRYDYYPTWLGISLTMVTPQNAKIGWEQIQTELNAGNIPIVRIDASKLPDMVDKKTATYMVVHRYNESEETVGVSSLFYNGQLPLSTLTACREAISIYGLPAHSWLKLQVVKEILTRDPSSLYKFVCTILCQDPKTGESIQNNINAFSDILQILTDLPTLLVRIQMHNLSNQFFHPLGPPESRKKMLQILKILHNANYLSIDTVSQYEKISSDWDLLKMLLYRSTIGQPKEALERIQDRLRNIGKLEKEAYEQILHEIKVK
ncbi:hypothetical protein E8L90_06250 [Brevibacillus antibioticus]|uniref:Uncharacterized protein n=1 Tax=Brevibacillus antibioticus TaxID=2570228 RepID=A0A4U2Y3N5_9BACL|nr:hypothetical protein [Brevibacillus antibioticus]TKI55090.1 hypothetical protein E8L90_06250 [Brevibacillus antibioticus]